MAIKTELVRYGEHSGYLAWPEKAGKPLPAVVVIQELWGVDSHIEDVTRRFAGAGYAALAPDLYAQGGVRPPALSQERIRETQLFMSQLPPTAWADPGARETEMLKLPEPQRSSIGETYAALFAGMSPGGLRLERYLEPLKSSVEYLRNDCPRSRGQKTGCVGFCMGGGLAALLACHEDGLSASVIYYGTSPAADLVPGIACPVLGFYGGLDTRVNATLPGFIEAMNSGGKEFEHHVYDRAQHGFFNDGRQSYDVDAARDSFARTLDFFGERLAHGSRAE